MRDAQSFAHYARNSLPAQVGKVLRVNIRSDDPGDDYINELFLRLGKNIKSRREHLKMAKRAIARAAGMGESTYRNLENPSKRPTTPTKGPTISMIAAVAGGLQLQLWQLLTPDFRGDKPPKLAGEHDEVRGLSDDELRLISWLREDESGSRIAGILLSHGLVKQPGQAAPAKALRKPVADQSGGSSVSNG